MRQLLTTKTKNLFNNKKEQQQISAINESESDQVLKLGFWINNNNKTKPMKTTTTILPHSVQLGNFSSA